MLRQLGGESLGKPTLKLPLPKGFATDSNGEPLQHLDFAPTDPVALVGAVGLATAHFITQDYTLNNLMACLIASDILQLVRAPVLAAGHWAAAANCCRLRSLAHAGTNAPVVAPIAYANVTIALPNAYSLSTPAAACVETTQAHPH